MAVLALGVLLPATAGCSLLNGGAAASQKTAWAHVNGHPISGTEVMNRVHLYQLLDPTSAGSLKGKRLRVAMTNRLVEEYLLVQAAKQHKVTPSASAVASEQSYMRKELYTVIYPSQKALDAAMKKLGVTMSDLDAYIKNVYTINAYLQQQVTVKPVTAAAIKAYYTQNKAQFKTPEEYHLRHILVKTKAEAQKIEAQLRASGGKNFAALAKKYSIDKGSAAKGGDLGYQPLSTYVAPFAQAAQKLKPNQISGIVHSQYGYHIIELLGTKPATNQTLKEATPQIRSMLTQQERQKAVSSYISKLEAKAKITVAVPNNA